MYLSIFVQFYFTGVRAFGVLFVSMFCRRKKTSFCVFMLDHMVEFLNAINENCYLYSSLFSEISPVQHDDEGGALSEVDQPPIIQLLASIWFGILAHSCLLCYFMVFLHQIKNASVLSTPLPLMVFCWGSLTIPRPSKTFWITLIAYTEVKYKILRTD